MKKKKIEKVIKIFFLLITYSPGLCVEEPNINHRYLPLGTCCNTFLFHYKKKDSERKALKTFNKQ